jgi:hypothetical protein
VRRAGEILAGNKQLSALTSSTRKALVKISPQSGKRIEGVEMIRNARNSGCQELAFNSRPFVLCGLPIRRLPRATREYSRVNGRYNLRIAANSTLGLPFGQDRLIPIWVSTLAMRAKSREVTFDSVADLLREFDLGNDGRHYRRVVQGFERIFDATIYFGTNSDRDSSMRCIDRYRFNFFDRIRLWRVGPEPGLPGEDFKNVIVLSEAFWNEIQRHPIPLDRRVVIALAHAPGALDFACWLSWRCFTARGTQVIPLFGDGGLIMQLGVQSYSRERRFRQQIASWLQQLRLLWPECPVTLSERSLIVNPGLAIRPVEWKPIVSAYQAGLF